MQQMFSELTLINLNEDEIKTWPTNENLNIIEKNKDNMLSNYSDIMQVNEAQMSEMQTDIVSIQVDEMQVDEMQADEFPDKMQMDEVQMDEMQLDEMQKYGIKFKENLITDTNNEIMINGLLLLHENSIQKRISKEDYTKFIKQYITLKNSHVNEILDYLLLNPNKSQNIIVLADFYQHGIGTEKNEIKAF